MINLEVLGNDPVTLGVDTGNTIQLRSADNPVDSVISVNGKQGVVVLKASDIEGAGVPTNVREAIFTLLNNAAYVTTGLDDEIAIVEAWSEEVTALTLSDSTLALSGSTPQTITATTVPSGKSVSWVSSDNSVATVNAGVVTGVSNGTCTITASAGSLTATCEVTVSGFVTLESISAVYTQSGNIYETTPLDDLKTDLVVTATYDDTTTATVPSEAYTLSGTLEVGTSTITVSYGGKTTTFTVTVTSYWTLMWSYEDGGLPSAVASSDWQTTDSTPSGHTISFDQDHGIKWVGTNGGYTIAPKNYQNTSEGVMEIVVRFGNTNNQTLNVRAALYATNDTLIGFIFNGGVKINGSGSEYSFIPNTAININQDYTLRVERTASLGKVYLDGVEVYSGELRTLTGTNIVMISTTSGAGNGIVYVKAIRFKHIS